MKQPAPGSTRHSAKYRGAVPTPILILTLCMALSASAAEVYTWTDENGVQHFSDTPREGGAMQALEVDEIYRPGSSDAYSAPEAGPEQPPAMPGQTEAETPKTAAEARREAMAKNRSQRREQQAETERLCALHRQRLEQMEPARRVLYTDESGEQVRMDDDQRMALIDESRAYVDQNCKG